MIGPSNSFPWSREQLAPLFW